MKGFISFWWKMLNQLCFLFFPLTVIANSNDSLIMRLELLLQKYKMDSSIVQKVTLKTPIKSLPTCPLPKLQLTSHNQLSGNMSIIACCDKQRFFLQIHVRSYGDYWIAARTLPIGTYLKENDIIKKHGELNSHPYNIIFANQPVIGLFTTRIIHAGQPLASIALRLPYKVHQGNPVAIAIHGQGFQVRYYGKAMSNAAVGDILRVRLASGQIVSGVVNSQGVVLQNTHILSSSSSLGR